jgi:MFS family permease
VTSGDRIPASRLGLLTAAYAVSSFGSYLNFIALGLFAFALTGSAFETGLFMALRLGTGFVAGPAAGWLASRYPRKGLMIGSDLLCAAAVGAVGLWPSTGLLYVLALVVGAATAQWNVAMRSSVPELVAPEDLVRANGRLVSSRSVAMLLGFASAGVLVSWLGFSLVFLIDALSYVVCATLLLFVPIRASRKAGVGEPAKKASTLVLRALAPGLLAMIAVRSLDAFGSASHNVALPVYATQVWPGDPAAFAAIFTTAWATGSLVAGRWLARKATSVGFGIATCLMSVLFVLAFTGLPLWLLVVVAAGAGAADGYAEISYTSRLQRIDSGRRPALFGFAHATQNAGFGLGMMLCGALLTNLAPFTVVAGAHAVAFACALCFLLMILRGTWGGDDEDGRQLWGRSAQRSTVPGDAAAGAKARR